MLFTINDTSRRISLENFQQFKMRGFSGQNPAVLAF
jgi:hypothetical protein